MRASMTWLSALFLAGFIASAAVLADSVNSPPARLGDGWSVGSLTEAGFDPEKMRLLDQQLEAGEFTNVHMVAVESDGRLIYEKYLSGRDRSWGTSLGHREFGQDSLHDLRSISKSVTALLLGIALGDEYESALSRPIVEYFPEYASSMPPGSEKMTLYHVLTMSTGQEWNEMDVPYTNRDNDERRLYRAPDPIEAVLAKPMRNEPGSQWYYNGGTTMVLAALVEKVSEKPFLDFARESLFEPLGIRERDIEWRGRGIWETRPTMPSAASGLRLRLRDLAKIGSLMLHDGRWNGDQVVPAGWIRASSLRQTEQTYSKWSMDGVYGYGYQWWHGEFRGDWGNFTAVTGVGYGGQRLFVISERKLVVTVFAGNYGTGIWRMSEQVMARVVDASEE